MDKENNLIYAGTDDGVEGVIRDRPPEFMTMNDGRYFVRASDDAGIARLAAEKLIDAIDNHYSDGPEFAALYKEAKELLGIQSN